MGNEKDYRSFFQKRFKELCDANNKSYQDVSNDSDVSVDTIKSLMSARRKELPRIDTIDAIAHGFGITLAEFLDDSEDRILIERVPVKSQDRYARLHKYQKEFVQKTIYMLDKTNNVNLDDINE